MSPRGVTVEDQNHLSCSETRCNMLQVNTCCIMTVAPIWINLMSGIYLWFRVTNKWRAASLQPGWGFDNFKPTLECFINKCFSSLNRFFFFFFSFFFWRWWLGLSKRGSQDLSYGTNVASWLANFFLSAHRVYGVYPSKFKVSCWSRNLIFSLGLSVCVKFKP